MKKGGNPNKEWTPLYDQPLDKLPISFKGYAGMRERLMKIENWADKMRISAEQLINAEETAES